jgi:hypothetical protein
MNSINRSVKSIIFIYVLFLGRLESFCHAEGVTETHNRNVDIKELNNQELFKAGTTIKAVDRSGRIKREQVTEIKRREMVAFMTAIYNDGRLDGLMRILKFLEEVEGDSCPACYSVFGKFATIGKELSDKGKRGYLLKTKVKEKKSEPIKEEKNKKTNKNEPQPPPAPQRELSLAVMQSLTELISKIRSAEERKAISAALFIMRDEFGEKRNKTPGERDYFMQLAGVINMALSSDENYQEEEEAYLKLEEFY